MIVEDLACILWKETDKYVNSLSGIQVSPQWIANGDNEFYWVRLVVLYKYKFATNPIPYSSEIPRFWLDMSEDFIRKNFQIMIRHLIKVSLTTEIERFYGWKEGFNPL